MGDDDITKRIMHLFQLGTDITIKDVVDTLQIARSTAGRKLKLLVNQKIIKKVGLGRGSYYILRKNK